MNQYDIILECFEELERDGTIKRVYKGYSGRGMYGRKCLGIVTDDEWGTALEVAKWLFENYEKDAEDILEELSDSRVDSLGRNIIIYFPGIEIDEDDEEEEEEEETE